MRADLNATPKLYHLVVQQRGRRATRLAEPIPYPSYRLPYAKPEQRSHCARRTPMELQAGDWFVEQRADVVKVFADPDGIDHLADMEVVDFLDGLARRRVVFVSWG